MMSDEWRWQVVSSKKEGSDKMIQKYVMKPAIKNRGEAIITQSKD
jgi:hypothetical protein